jgi:uncharacterized repeat protein (TIGR01451 family)
MRKRMLRREVVWVVAVWVVAVWGVWGRGEVRADEQTALRRTWRGDVNFFATGTSLAADLGGAAGTVETSIQPQTVVVRAPQDVPTGARLEAGFVYWAGSRSGTDCTSQPDRQVTLTVPGGTARTVTADVCYCGAGAVWSDQQVCRYEMTGDLRAAGGRLDGSYTLSDFAARIQDSATDNASFSVVLVYRYDNAGVRHVLLYDGIWELYQDHPEPAHQVLGLSLGGFQVDNPPSGKLAYYVIEGDEGGSGTESVTVNGQPGAAGVLTLSDSVNGPGSPFNRTINTVSPPRTGVVGVDIDQFDITAALNAGDTSLLVTYDGSRDKTWLVYNIISTSIYEPLFEVRSTKQWAVRTDLGGDGQPSPGDTLRFTIRLENTGNEAGTTILTDNFGPEVSSWQLVSHTAGVNNSQARLLLISDISVPIGGVREVVFDVVLADVPDRTSWTNAASFSAPPQGGAGGILLAPQLTIRRDGDGDGVFDFDDNCPLAPNTNQANTDGDSTGNVCDPCPLDSPNDSDADTVCDSQDRCPGSDDRQDADADTVPNACDVCPGGNDLADTDRDGAPNACDRCLSGDDRQDADADTVPNVCDVCAGGDDRIDTDGDGIPNACDACLPGQNGQDTDRDTIPDACDVCFSGDDHQDADNDTIPDACDACPNANDLADADRDGAPDACDLCTSGDDFRDGDGDGVPDACDVCLVGDDAADADADTVPDACDLCLSGDDRIDTDGDGFVDACDVCPAAAQSSTDPSTAADADADTVPDVCDRCPGGDDFLDADADGAPDACDLCPDFDDRLDADGDGSPDACDLCSEPDLADTDADTTPDACDRCPAGDDRLDTDDDGIPDACDREQCADALDNDGDSFVDCDDPDCAISQRCQDPEPEPEPQPEAAAIADDPPGAFGQPEDCRCTPLRHTRTGLGGGGWWTTCLAFTLTLSAAALTRRRAAAPNTPTAH